MRFREARSVLYGTTALLAVLLLGACAEINKPIRPNDPWRERATMQDTSLPRE